MLVPMRVILEAANQYSFGQPAFNVNSVAQIKAAVETHEVFRSPAILQGADLANGFMGGRVDFANSTLEDKKRGAKNIVEGVKRYGAESDIPIAIHLDHGKNFDSVVAAVEGGYTSVMIDGSSLPFEENVELTREVVKYAHERGVTVEGELGILAGVEDDVASVTSTYTHPLSAIDFFKKTKVDALAISYGTKHGANKGKDTVIRKQIPIAIKECMIHEGIHGFLVSHGSSTVPQYIVRELLDLGSQLKDMHGIAVDQLVEVIQFGINKINVDTDIRLAVTRNLKELFLTKKDLQQSRAIGEIYRSLEAHPEAFDPRLFVGSIMDTIMHGEPAEGDLLEVISAIEAGTKEAVGPLLIHFGALGKAPLVEKVSLDEMAERYKAQGI